MIELKVELGDRSYPIFIGTDLLSRADFFKPYVQGKRVMVVTNETVAPLYLAKVQAALTGLTVDAVILPDGEEFKDWQTLNKIFDALLEKAHSRKTTIVALGGGVVGDMAGFAAACYQRGVPFIQVPTTLLSQVDSSVGGKTGINHPLGKNMIGAFYQPQAVVIDTQSLLTLPEREVSAGLAEVIKYGLIRDAKFFAWLEANIEKLRALDDAALSYAIEVSCQCKADVVAEDEREGSVRALLNLGHTFGHAIETNEGYGNWLHGEAVGAGMVMAAHLSLLEGWLSQDDYNRTVNLIRRAGLPVDGPQGMTYEQYLKAMSVDKKVLDGSLRLVLLKNIGDAVVTEDFGHDRLLQVLAAHA